MSKNPANIKNYRGKPVTPTVTTAEPRAFESHLGGEADMWPAQGSSGPKGGYTDKECVDSDGLGLPFAGSQNRLATAITDEKSVLRARTAVFMSTPINDRGYEATPESMLCFPVEDIGMIDVAEEWVLEILASDDPECIFDDLFTHLSGLLRNVKLIRQNYRRFIETAT